VLQRHGFFSAEISDIRVKLNDPLGSPKPVSIEAEIKEGPRYRLSALHFTGNRTFSSRQLRGAFPIHRHDRFETDKVRTGLESLQALYLTKGYLEISVEPATALNSNATAALLR
jgi:outer membrane protein assembly factor BamA